MLLNMANLRAVHKQLMQFTMNSSNFDLDYKNRRTRYYRGYYLDQGALFGFFQEQRSFLPLEYNWRPYWRFNKDHYIMHFAGPKAHEHKSFLLNKTEESDRPLLHVCRKNSKGCVKNVAIYEEWQRRVMANDVSDK